MTDDIRRGDWIFWMRRTALVQVVSVNPWFVCTRGRPGVSSLVDRRERVRSVFARQA